MTEPAKKGTKKFKLFKFKGFGSLSSLPRVFTFRRTSSATRDQGLQNLRSPGGNAFENTQDDLNALPRSPSYARSSDMYSHMGTMPRTNSNRVLKPVQVQSVACKVQGPQTPPSPTSTASLLSQKNGTAAAYACQILDNSHTKSAGDMPEQAEQHCELSAEPLDQNCTRDQNSKSTESQTGQSILNLAMDEPPSQNQCETETSLPHFTTKTDLGTTAAADVKEDIAGDSDEGLQPDVTDYPKISHRDDLELGSEYVKFSKEKYILDSSPEKLHKELEEELKLNSADLRSNAWYHGRIPREVSESLVQRNGDFLIRDSLTSLGDYVLSCRWKNEPLHFKINKVMVRTADNCTRIQYLFEQESFDNIPALVRFYVGNRHAVSEQSGAVIYCPINRTFPLRYLEASYGLANGRHGGSHSPSSHKGGHMKRRSITMTDGLTADKITRGEACPNSISSPHHRDVIRNCAVSVDQIHDMHVPMSPISETPGSPAYSTVTRLKPHTSAIPPASPVLRRSSEPQICPENNNKPDCAHSVPCHGYTHTAPQVPCYPSTDSGHYCQLRPASPAGWERPTHDSPSRGAPHKSYVERLRGDEARLCPAPVKDNVSGSQDGEVSQRKKVERDWTGFVLPTVEMKSAFNPAQFKSTLIPLENKPLEMTVLKKVKELLAEADAKTIAGHITKADCQVARILAVTKEMQRLMGVGSGMELLTLPHGRQLRLDLLERFHTMSIMIAVDILGCTGSTEERAAMLHKTIQLAAELKSTMGNMFSFAAVMNALEMSQISRLEQTWMGLRQRHTEGAILYEKKLKPFLKGLNEGKEGSPLTNTTFPHIVPLITLLERDCIMSETGEPWESIDGGVEVVMAHLEAARMVAHHGGLYRTNAEMKLHGFLEKAELMEVFSTEFQMRLLWGSRGAESSQAERYEKFDKVLTALSHKLEPSVRFSEL